MSADVPFCFNSPVLGAEIHNAIIIAMENMPKKHGYSFQLEKSKANTDHFLIFIKVGEKKFQIHPHGWPTMLFSVRLPYKDLALLVLESDEVCSDTIIYETEMVFLDAIDSYLELKSTDI